MENNNASGDNANKANEDGLDFDVTGLGTEIKTEGQGQGAETEEEKAAKLKATEDAAKKKADEDAAAAAANAGKDEKPTGVEVDGKAYKFDAEGNAVDEFGVIKKTKAEVDAILEEQEKGDDNGADGNQEEVPLTLELQQKIGIEVLGEDGKPKQYTEDITGLTQMVTDVAEELNNRERKEFFETYPEVAALTKHLMNGGTSEDFFKKQSESWKNVSLKDADENLKLSIVTKDLIAKGFETKEAEETAKLYKDSNKLDDMADKALKSRQAAEDKAIQDKALADKAAYDEQVANATKEWKAIEGIINKGDLSLITIPEVEKKAFNAYISKAVDDKGNSQLELDRAKLSLEQKLAFDYLIYAKLDITKLVQNKAATMKAQSLRTRLGGSQKEGIQNAQNQDKHQKNGNDSDFDMDSVIV